MATRRVLPDLNALSIQLVDDHPGHPYVAEELVPALSGSDALLVFGYLPLRVQWILEDLGFDTVEVRNAVSSLLQYPIEFVDVDDETIVEAYDLSAEKNHDVYDCFYLALANAAGADVLVTTDRDSNGSVRTRRLRTSIPFPNGSTRFRDREGGRHSCGLL